MNNFVASGWVVKGPKMETVKLGNSTAERFEVTILTADKNRKTGQVFKRNVTLVAWKGWAVEYADLGVQEGEYVEAEGTMKEIMEQGVGRMQLTLEKFGPVAAPD